jgi:hypothetical protein
MGDPGPPRRGPRGLHSQLQKQVRWTPGDHPDKAARWDWVTGKLLEIITVQQERIDALERQVAELRP